MPTKRHSQPTPTSLGPGCMCVSQKKDPGFRNDVHEETSPYLLLGAPDQRLGAEQDQLPCVGSQELLLAPVQRRKLAWFGHFTRHDSLSKTVLQRTLENGQRRGRQRKFWIDNIREWTSQSMPELFTKASCRKDWNRISVNRPSCPPPPPTQSVMGLI